jgi:hypothetical protein
MKIAEQLRATVHGLAVSAWWQLRPGQDTLDSDQVDRAKAATQSLIDHTWPEFATLIAGAAAAGAVAMLSELGRQGLLARPPEAQALALLMERVPQAVLDRTEITVEPVDMEEER